MMTMTTKNTSAPGIEGRKYISGVSTKARAAFDAGAERLKNQEVGENEVAIYGEIVDDMYKGWFYDAEGVVFPSDFRAALAETEGDITVRMNSPGGDVFAGAVIAGAIDDVRRDDRNVTVRVDGLAASAASFIAIRGNEVVLDELAQVMIHPPWSALFGGDWREFAKMAEQLKVTEKALIDTYTARNRKGLDRETIEEMVIAETWMDAEEAIKQGFADRVMEPPQDRKKKKKNVVADDVCATIKACADVRAEIQRAVWNRISQQGGK